jgi:NADPH:quinone reductase-like Zn-dependent oxidoreductase
LHKYLDFSLPIGQTVRLPACSSGVRICEIELMRSLQLYGDRDLRVTDIEAPPAPAAGEVQIRVRAIGLNFLDVWGFRGMAFAKRKMPQAAGVEASGEVVALGAGVSKYRIGQKVTMYGAETCGTCKACMQGHDNLCENVAGVMGFHIDGFARELINRPERLVVPVPDSVSFEDAACAPIGFGTVQHMLFDNAKLEPGESILIHAGGSGIGTAAIKMAKAIGCTVYTTVGDDEKGVKAKALGADHVINYRTERFEGEVRLMTRRKGVDVVFEHVGADTWNGSLLCLKRGGRLVTCGATSGATASINLMQLFQQQYRITGSFGCRMENIAQSLAKMEVGMTPVIDSVFPLEQFQEGLTRLEGRQVFGKVIVTL